MLTFNSDILIGSEFTTSSDLFQILKLYLELAVGVGGGVSGVSHFFQGLKLFFFDSLESV